MVLPEAKLGLGEELIDNIVAATNPVVDQIVIAIWAGHEQRRRVALTKRGGKFNRDARPVVKGANRLPSYVVSADTVAEVKIFDGWQAVGRR